jgi:hypothetical protein
MPSQDDVCRCLVCQDYGDRDQLGSVDRKLINGVRERGWGVLAIPEDEVSAGWAFTIGLWHSYRSPEVAVFGLDGPVMMRCLNALGDQVAAGRPVVAHEEREGIINNHAVTLKPVHDGWRRAFLGTAHGFYRATRGVSFLQLLWPDRAGLFPGQVGFMPQYGELQPRLWLSPDDHPAGVWTQQV